GQNSLGDRRSKRVPIYLTTDTFSVGIRTFQMSQRTGQPIDLSMVKQKTRRVNEAVEDSFINGVDLAVEGYTAYGILNAPNGNTHTIDVSWLTDTGENILA